MGPTVLNRWQGVGLEDMKTENCRRKTIISICRFQPSVVGRLLLQHFVIKMMDFISCFFSELDELAWFEGEG